MKKTSIALLALFLSAPSWAQDAPAPADTPPADASSPPADASTPPPADQGAAPVAPADASTPPADASTPPPADASAPPAETPPAEQPPAEQTADKGEPWGLYIGADYGKLKVSSSGAGTLGTNDYNGKMIDFRIGKRLFEAVGLELHYGLDMADVQNNEIETDRYYGLFVVPTATLFETVELAFPVGYGRGQYAQSKLSAVSNSVAYGFRAELPIKKLSDSLPDIRLTSGWMIFNQTSALRVYGWEAGVRYDFQVPNPGLGSMFKHLWPFGHGDDKPADAPPAS